MAPSDVPKSHLSRTHTVTALQNWITQSPGGSAIAAPMKARACRALYAMRRGRPRPPVTGPNLMRPGAERC
ncbi:MAG: hypothetical protein CK429_00750 [Mycobacterium sp.]|nr:MAG: hypothetical protein CK429_00750 [Mycobacterium sp.]